MINENRMHDLLGKMVSEMGAAAVGSLVILGDKLGLYRALAKDGPLSAGMLAEKTGTTERYVREWCAAQAGSGYIEYEADTDKFSMSPEQQAVFADPDSPFCMTGGFYAIGSIYVDEPKITHAFQTGEGVSWGDHSACLFCGTEKFFRPGYQASLVSEWLPSLDGVIDKLEAGAKVADVGCGHGASTLVMAKAFPKSSFIGFDFHEPSVKRANELASDSGLANVRFDVAAAKNFPGTDYDLIAFFDCLHDMGDPVGAAAHTLEALRPDGTMMLVEPFAHDELKDNLNPVGRMFYSFSTMVCTPASISQEVGLALGAQAGEKRLSEVAAEAGFSQFRRATETPFNLVLEAKP
ncbi:Demethylrebeccamycin-D-glucose O-methyltransferase [Rosistilla carotiformis]|uniref:Demethylrebeccamycin-D-glucose O-methyltransferase n=1 Tax=Rosistilla carotiformis TaxID=2528017 RepID=A0A518JMR1_9BACT|nr:class I SAM-dependent methyltransferase [Rosistilla carotiformis]QDV66832.1 Demethylrebeccamycin-D-glucose O-methyltransferase [Rosistilla carotiformis]